MIDYILSYDFIAAVYRMTTPLLFAALASLVQSKADFLCIGNECIMLFAALGGVLGSVWTQSLLGGLLIGVLAGELIAVIFAVFVLYLNTDSMLTGLALNIFGSGTTVYLLFLITGDKASSVSLSSLVFPAVELPFISKLPVLGSVISGHNMLFYLAVAMLLFVSWLMNRTCLGLRISAVGENPDAANSVGINVKRVKVVALLIGGMLASFGGIYMSMGYLTCFTREMVAGRSFIGIAAQTLGGGNPWITAIATLLFGIAQAIRNISQSYRLSSYIAYSIPYIVTIIGLIVMGRDHGAKRIRLKQEKNI